MAVSVDEKKLRQALADRLALRGLSLRPAIWRDLVNSKNVKLVLDGRSSFERLLEIYLDKEETYYPQPGPVARCCTSIEDSHARARALSELCARLLCGYCGVDAFRLRAGLAGRLLSAEQVGPWILEQAQGGRSRRCPLRHGPGTGRASRRLVVES